LVDSPQKSAECQPVRADGTADAQAHLRKEQAMLYYAVVFFVIALVAAFFGFSGVAVGAASIAKVLFVVFLVVALVSLVAGRRAPV
jgi:uncharacterized membrane protein YtjA (UPF0391 family)